MSGKPPASRTCWFACQGNRQLPGLADSHVRETISFPDLLSPQSGGGRRAGNKQPRNPRPSLLLLAKCHKLTAEVNYGTADNRGLLAGCCSVVFSDSSFSASLVWRGI